MAGATGTMGQRMAVHAFYTMFFPKLAPLAASDVVPFAAALGSLTLDGDTAFPNDYPRGCTMEASPGGKTWTAVARASQVGAEAAQQKGVLTITFPPADARFLRITNLGTAPGLYWKQ